MKNEDGNEANHEKLLSTAIIMRWDVRVCVRACMRLFVTVPLNVMDRCSVKAGWRVNKHNHILCHTHTNTHTHTFNAKSAFYWASFWFDSKLLLPFKWISLKNNLFVLNGNWLCVRWSLRLFLFCVCVCASAIASDSRMLWTSECPPIFRHLH